MALKRASVRPTPWLIVGAGIAAGAAVNLVAGQRRRRFELSNRVVFISGGSRGLGLLLAHEFLSRGARVAISARDAEELSRAARQLRTRGEVVTAQCDTRVREEVEAAAQSIQAQLGSIDILVNNAGTITVGPMETMTPEDYRTSLATHFWGPYFTTMAVLPGMQRRKSGRIVNICSIGGIISVPHLISYSVGKFALRAFSQGLRAELRKDNVYVTTVCPGLMRTGSPRNALFKGRNQAEYAWFSISDALPLVSISGEHAARAIVNACERGQGELILSAPAKFAAMMHGLFPGMTADVLSLVNRFLPAAGGIGSESRTGAESSSSSSPSWATVLNERAAERNNQFR